MDRILLKLFLKIPGNTADRAHAGWADYSMDEYLDEKLWFGSLPYRVGWREARRKEKA